MKKVIYFLILLFFSPFVYAKCQVDNYKIDMIILDNGDVKISEAFKMSGDYNGYERIINYKGKYNDYYGNKIKSSDNTFYDASSIKIDSISAINFSNIDLELLEKNGDVFLENDNAIKGEHGYYKVIKTDKGNKIKIFNPSKMNKDFYMKYTIKNASVTHNDVSELALFLLDDLNEDINNLIINIHIPNNKNIIKVWTHKQSVIQYLDKENIEIKINKLNEQDSLDMRIIFDKIKSSKITNDNVLNKINIIEQNLQNNPYDKIDQNYRKLKENAYSLVNKAANTYKKNDFDEAYEATKILNTTDELRTELLIRLLSIEPKVLRKMEIIKILLTSLMIFWILGVVVFIYYIFRHIYKIKITNSKPQKINPGVLGILLHRKININDLTASFLSLIDKKIITYEKKKEKYRFKLIKNNMSNIDYKLVNFIFNEKSEITFNYVNKKSKKDFDNYLKLYSNWIDACYIESKKYFDNLFVYKFFGIMYSLLGLIIGTILLDKNTYFSSKIILLLSIFFLIYNIFIFKRSKLGKEEYIKWKNYSLGDDFTDIIYSISLRKKIDNSKYNDLITQTKKELYKSIKNATNEKKLKYN